jgi:hypothetical protein
MKKELQEKNAILQERNTGLLKRIEEQEKSLNAFRKELGYGADRQFDQALKIMDESGKTYTARAEAVFAEKQAQLSTLYQTPMQQ